MVAPWVIPAIAAGASILGKLTDKSGDTAESTTTVNQYPNWNEEQQAIFQNLATLVGTDYSATAVAPTMSVGTTDQEQQYFDIVNKIASSKAASGAPLYDVGTDWAEQYYNDVIKSAYMQEYEDITQPQIAKSYAGKFYTSGRQEAETEAAQDLATRLASAKAELMYGEEKAAREALDTAYSQQLQAAEAVSAAGETQRSIEQEVVYENLARYFMGEEVDESYNPIYNPQVQLAMSLLGLSPYTYATETTSEESSSGAGGLSSIFSGLGAGLGAFGK